jgi:hypothetical protein
LAYILLKQKAPFTQEDSRAGRNFKGKFGGAERGEIFAVFARTLQNVVKCPIRKEHFLEIPQNIRPKTSSPLAGED